MDVKTKQDALYKRVLSVVLALAFCLALMPAWSLPTAAAEATPTTFIPDSGSGSEDDPWVISTAEQLKQFADEVNSGNNFKDKFIELANPIDLLDEGVCGKGIGSWTPIGIMNPSLDVSLPDNNFSGTFDGKGNEIRNLYIDNVYVLVGNKEYGGGKSIGIGLFGRNSGTVKNLTVSGTVTVKGGNSSSKGGNPNDPCSAEYAVAGIVGYNTVAGTIDNCVNKCNVTLAKSENASRVTPREVGGVAGLTYGTISNSQNHGEVTSDQYVGGIAGYAAGNSKICTLENCFNTGKVSSENADYIGGIVGRAEYLTDNCYIKNCYNIGEVSGSGTYIGGIVGKNNNAEVTYCYYLEGKADGGINGTDEVGKAESKTEAEFASGEVAWLLNGEKATPAENIVWHQNISTAPTDKFPGLAGDESTIVNKLEPPYTYTDSNGVEQTIEYANPPGDVRLPEGASVQLGDTTVTVPKGGTMRSAESVTISEDESAKIGGSVITIPEGGTLNSNDGNGVIVPEDTEVKLSDGTEVTLPEGGIIDKDGNIVTDKLGLGETVIEYPDDTEVKANGDGTVTVPDGTTVTPPKGTPVTTIIDADNKATVDKDGNITFPGANGGSIRIGSADITVPSNGTMEPQSDGKVFLPDGSAATLNGQTTNAPPGGGVYDPANGTWDGDSTGNSGNNSGNGTGDNSGNGTGDNSGNGTGDNSGNGTGDNSGNGSGNGSVIVPPPSAGNNTSDGISADDINVGSADGNNVVTIGKDSVGTLKNEVIASHLTDDDKAAIKDGNKLDIILSAEDAGVPDADKQAAQAFLDGTDYTIGSYLDIDLLKQINGEEVGKITELNSPITLVFIIPEELRKENRVFGIVRIHEGETKFFEDLDNDPDTITIVTDRFSTYVIVYKDLDASASDNPNTGAVPITVIGLAAAVSAAAVTFRKKKTL